MTDDERLARNMAKLDAQRAIRERAIAAVQSQRDTAAGKRDEYGNPPTRKRPAKKKVRRAVTTRAVRDPQANYLAQEAAERRAQIVTLYAQGKETADIATLMGIARATVYDHLRIAGVKLRPKNDPLARQARVRALYEAGMTTQQVADALSVHRHTVQKALKAEGIKGRGGKPRAKLDDARLVEMYEQGATCAEIAELHGVVPNTVWKRLKAAGVTMRIAGPRAAA